MVARTCLNVPYVHCLSYFHYVLIIDRLFVYFTSLFNRVGFVALNGTAALGYRMKYELHLEAEAGIVTIILAPSYAV